MYGGVGFLLPTSFMADWQGTSLRLGLLAVSIPATTLVFLAGHRFFSLNTHQAWRSVTFYDASYHALAMTSRALFITADEKFLNKVADDPYCQHIRDWK